MSFYVLGVFSLRKLSSIDKQWKFHPYLFYKQLWPNFWAKAEINRKINLHHFWYNRIVNVECNKCHKCNLIPILFLLCLIHRDFQVAIYRIGQNLTALKAPDLRFLCHNAGYIAGQVLKCFFARTKRNISFFFLKQNTRGRSNPR